MWGSKGLIEKSQEREKAREQGYIRTLLNPEKQRLNAEVRRVLTHTNNLHSDFHYVKRSSLQVTGKTYKGFKIAKTFSWTYTK